jgi:crossover junction endodeoxyribonuclease RusA
MSIEDQPIILWLPWPPTINSYYAPIKGGIYLSRKGRLYRESVNEAINEQVPSLGLTERIQIELVYYPPDNRVRDLDNYKKALLDACTHADLWDDDSLIDQDFTYRGEIVKGGTVKLEINPAGPIMPYKLS